MRCPSARRVQYEPADFLWMMKRYPRGNPAAKGFTGYTRLVTAECVEHREHVRAVIGNLIAAVGLVGPTMADEVDCDCPEMLAMRRDVAAVSLRMAPRSVQQQQ